MKNQRLVQVGGILVAAALLVAAGRFLKPLDAQREAMGLSSTNKDLRGMPPEIALTSIALGGFRGLAVDYFWIRAEMLKQQGRLYEANQLANWTCKLQPRFPRVWAFQAWNLAWNISVLTHTFKERWNWVYNGIKLLRDEGIKYNPKSISLYRELAGIFFFKMGDFMDDYHLGYKRQWAWDMHRVLGDPPPDIQAEGVQFQLEQILAEEKPAQDLGPLARPQQAASDAKIQQWKDASVQRVIDWFARIANAPATWDGLLADAEMASFVERCEKAGIQLRSGPPAAGVLRSATTPEPNGEFFDEYQVVLTPTFRQQFDLQTGKLALTADATALRDLLNDPDARPRIDRVLNFLRRYLLVTQFKLDPAWMLSLMHRFGPVDWRLPDAHGMYWSSFGVKMVEENGVTNVEEFFGPNSSLNTDRMMMFALQRLTWQGRLFFEPSVEQIETSVLDVLPDLRFVDATHKVYLATARKYDPTTGKIAGEDFRDGHQNYLRDAVRYFYLYGQKDIAAYYYEYLRVNYNLRQGGTDEAYLVPLADFVKDPEFTERLSDPRIAMGAITSALDQAFRFLVIGENDKVNGLLRFAKDDLYEWYKRRHAENPNERMKLPPFEIIFNHVAIGRLNSAGGQEMLFVKARLWKSLPLATQVAIYDESLESLRTQAKAIGRAEDLDKLFPPPPGIEEHRQRVAAGKKVYQQGQEQNERDRDRQQQTQSVEELRKRSRGTQLQMPGEN